MPLPDGGKRLTICAFVSIEHQSVTDRRTERFAITISRSACIKLSILTRDKNRATELWQYYRFSSAYEQVSAVRVDFCGRQFGLREKIREKRRLLFLLAVFHPTLCLSPQHPQFLKQDGN